nr:unnamed protein product [Digitaria exilis]
MVTPPLVTFLPLLLILAAFSPEPTIATTHSKPKLFPPRTPLPTQALLRRHGRPSGSRVAGNKLAVTAAADGTNTTAVNPFTAHYFPQELDHFTFTPNASMIFYQKYLINDTFWRRPSAAGDGAAGPLFVYTGNEGDIEWFATNTGFMFDIAPKFGALLVFIESESLNCFSVIKASWDVLEERGSSEKGLLELSKMFRACQPLKYADSIGNWLETAITYTAMVDYPTPANFIENLPAYPVKEMCKIIDGFPANADILEKVSAAANLFYNYTGNQSCNQIETEDNSQTTVLDGWGWQACTEMVMPMSASNESMFPPSTFSYEETSAACFKSNGVRPRPHWITTEYGGYKIDKVLKRFGSNIIFSNGMRDPWSRGGVLKNISSSIVALVTEKGAHHLDLRSATKDDPNWVVEQRRQEVEIIQGWIDQYHQDMA